MLTTPHSQLRALCKCRSLWLETKILHSGLFPSAFGGERRWLRSVCFLSFLQSFFFVLMIPRLFGVKTFTLPHSHTFGEAN